MPSDYTVPDQFQIKVLKRRLRRELRARLGALPESYIGPAARSAGENVLTLPEFRTASSVFTYVSVGREPDTLTLISAGLAAGKRIFVPKIRKKGIMDAVEIRSLSELREGAFGLLEPESDSTVSKAEIGFAVIPCLSATLRGERLGHGGGYYDRFFADTEIPGAVLCCEQMLSEALPCTENDIRFGTVVTEARIIRIF